jgi:hypothetical protein
MSRKLMIAISWCFANNIKVFVKPVSTAYHPMVKLEIFNNGYIQKGKEVYKQNKDLKNKIQELYLNLYNIHK